MLKWLYGKYALEVILIGNIVFWVLLFAASQAFSHEWYTGLRNLDGVDCCGGKDCREATYDEITHSMSFVDENGQTIVVPIIDPDDVVPFRPLDGKAHVCVYKVNNQWKIRCFILPPMI